MSHDVIDSKIGSITSSEFHFITINISRRNVGVFNKNVQIKMSQVKIKVITFKNTFTAIRVLTAVSPSVYTNQNI